MNIVIVWAGGSGMSNIAHILRDLGYKNLVAIDAVQSQITDALAERGIPLFLGHNTYQVKADDILIYSEATRESSEVQQAFLLKKTQHLPMKIRNYFEFLGELSKYFRTIGFTGTNGKSSSTALAIVAWKELIPELGLWIVGALVPDLDQRSYYLASQKKEEFRQLFDFIFTGKKLPYQLIKKYYFFLEACEYKRHFLHLDLDYTIITNIELDHTDYYRDFEDYLSAFLQVSQKTKKQTFVLEDFPFASSFNNLTSISLRHRNLEHIRWKHTDANTSLIWGLFQTLRKGLSSTEIEKVMKPFKWIRRRMEYLGQLPAGAKLFSDYGHIASSLKLGYETLKMKFPDKKIIAIFQPHQLHRILVGREDFKSALSCFDEVYLYSIYAAREKLSDFADHPLFQEQNFSSLSDFWAFFAQSIGARYQEHFSDLEPLLDSVNDEYIVVVFTAGDLDYTIRKYFNTKK